MFEYEILNSIQQMRSTADRILTGVVAGKEYGYAHEYHLLTMKLLQRTFSLQVPQINSLILIYSKLLVDQLLTVKNSIISIISTQDLYNKHNIFKRLDQPKMYIRSSYIHLHVVPHHYDFILQRTKVLEKFARMSLLLFL